MVSSALFTVVDGIFVGRGIGSDAIAAVNIAAPIFMIAAGLGLMFGMGGGILASINLSRGKLVVANITVDCVSRNCSNLIRGRRASDRIVGGVFVLVLHIHSVHGFTGGVAVLRASDEP